MADIQKSKEGTWRARLYKNGRRESKTFPTKGEASAWIERRRAELSGRAALRPFSEWCESWLASKGTEIEPRTLDDYRGYVKRHIVEHLGDIKLGAIKPHHIRQWLDKLAKNGTSAFQRKKVLNCVKQILNNAVTQEQIPNNPATTIRPPRQDNQSKARSLTEAELAALLKAASGKPIEPIIWLSLDTGMRPGEVFALAWRNVDLEKRTVRVCESVEVIKGKTRVKATKTKGSVRTITITQRTADLLATIPRENERVFPSRNGNVRNYANWRKEEWSPLLKEAGLTNLRQYDLRHTCATLLLSKNVPIKVVAERLGHSTVVTTLHYYGHSIPSMQETAVREMENIFSENIFRADAGLDGDQVNSRSE
jgi:integrase